MLIVDDTTLGSEPTRLFVCCSDRKCRHWVRVELGHGVSLRTMPDKYAFEKGKIPFLLEGDDGRFDA